MSWPKVPFETIYEVSSRNGIYKTKEFHGSGVKIVNMGELFGLEFISNQEMNRVQMSDVELERDGLVDGDLLFGRRSLVESGAGKCSIVLNPTEPLTFESSLIRVRLDKSKAIPLFYYYWFKSHIGRAGIRAIVSGTNVKGIRGSDLKNVSLALPPIDCQKRIVEICKNYDDLIENNRRRIQLLEESARLLYKEWFVYLRFPGHEHVKIVDGVPEGWEISSVEQLSCYLNRGMSPTYDDDGEYLILNQKCIRNRLISLGPARRQAKEFSIDKTLNLGDILINSTGTGTLGRVAQVWTEMEKTTVDTHITIVRPSAEVPYMWLGFALMGMEKRLEDLGEGATNQKELKRSRIGEIKLLVPPIRLSSDFHEVAKNLSKQIQVLMQKNIKLAEARDLLLPRLMNGELTL